MSNDIIVSFDNEKLILVDTGDNILGYENKNSCHDGDGILHRAFSIFIFNSKNELLIQRRSPDKRLWGGYWSNTCCSHPRQGELYEESTVRRLKEEIGLDTPMVYLYKFRYQAAFGDEGSENELCSVYIGKTDRTPQINITEIEDWKYISREDLNKAVRRNPEEFTPWFKMEWDRLQKEFWQQIESLPVM
jgi:isopentenyl-diphosphate Delta-isomerase